MHRRSYDNARVIGLLLALAILVIACQSPVEPGGGEIDESTVSISGSLPESAINNAIRSESRFSTGTNANEYAVYVFESDRLSGISGIDPDLYDRMVRERRRHTVDGDGSFSFEVEDGNAFVAILVEVQADGREDAIGVLGIGVDGEEYWHGIDTELIDGNVSLGTLQFDPDGYDLTIAAEHDIFDIGATVEDVSRVAALAEFDDALRALINLVTFVGEIRPTFRFLSTEALESDNQWLDPASYETSGYRPIINLRDSPEESEEFFLYPANDEDLVLWDNGETINSTAEALEARPRDADSGDYYYKFYPYPDDHINEDYEDDPLAGGYLLSMPPTDGAWSVRAEEDQSTEFGLMYLNMYPPFDDEDNLLMPVPRLRVENDESGYMSRIEVGWAIWNGSDYEEISPERLEPFIDWYGFDLSGYRLDDENGNLYDGGEWTRADNVYELVFDVEPGGYRDSELKLEGAKWVLPQNVGDKEEGLEVHGIRFMYRFPGFVMELSWDPPAE